MTMVLVAHVDKTVVAVLKITNVQHASRATCSSVKENVKFAIRDVTNVPVRESAQSAKLAYTTSRASASSAVGTAPAAAQLICA